MVEKQEKKKELPLSYVSDLERIAFCIGTGAGILSTIIAPNRSLEMCFLSPAFLIPPTLFIAYNITHRGPLSCKLAALHYGGYLVGEALALGAMRYL